MFTASSVRVGVLLAALLAPLEAYNPPVDRAGPLTARIDGPERIDRAGVAVPVQAVLSNAGAQSLRGRLRVTAIDGWTVAPAAVDFEVDGHASRAYAFQVTPARGSYSALYPIHAFAEFRFGEAALTAHPVLLVKTEFADAPRPAPTVAWKAIEMAADSRYALWRAPARRVVLVVFSQPPRTLPVGWEGNDADTRANASFGGSIQRGATRECIAMHEPWAHGAGTILAEYPLALPDSTPIELRFANAVRDDDAGRPPGDGVTFRVRVLPLEAPEGRQGEVLFERHTKSATWLEGTADLSRFAGRRIRLQLESHPGPSRNTTNDQSYWAEPTLVAGHPPAPPAFPPAAGAAFRSLGHIAVEGAATEIRVYPGTRGLLDSAIAFAAPGHTLAFRGFAVRVEGDALEDPRSPAVLVGARDESSGGRYRVRHSFRAGYGTFDLVGELWVEGRALRAHWRLEHAPAPRPWFAPRIESAGAGPFSETARRVYAGDGNVLESPGAFTLSFDGHELSTSYAGFDFAGFSLLLGVDAPPNHLAVDPASRTYSLRAAHEQTMTFIPARTAWDAVKAWRDIDGLRAAGGVGKLAGRFVFDLWGGKYAASAEALQRAFRYGLTDSVVVWHNWQRWGYDYRLPDILPPNPELGTPQEFAALAELCRKNGVLFAPHDNYIDYYPDASGFSYNRIAFSGAGAPAKAWFNKGRAAQAYRWRADCLGDAMRGNVTALRDLIAPTAYFIDVWSSAGPYDYWTRDGAFRDRLSTRRVWAETFNWIRQTLGANAPQISESGHDQLIGALDGGQTNHLRVDTPPEGAAGWTVWNIQAAGAERIPWYDAAHHDRFVLQGAGYGDRYAGGLDAAMHGIYSDDYAATEVLDGHPAMVPAPMGRDVVREYWLLHDAMRALALARFESHEFAGGDLHRQHVKWEGGGEVWVNRGTRDWEAAGHTLPQYGFYARVPVAGGVAEAAIERRDGAMVEWSRSPAATYANARPYVTGRLPLAVSVGRIEDLGGRQFRLTLNWNASGAIPDGYRIFVHFTEADGKILFQGDHNAPSPSGQWRGAFATSVVARVPDGVAAGRHFELRVGLYRAGGERAWLAGLSDAERRVRLATVEWSGTAAAWQPLAAPPDALAARFNGGGRPIAFDRLTTAGAVRMTRDARGTLLTPLAGGAPFEIRLRVDRPARAVEALDESGKVTASSAARMEDGAVVVARNPAVFAYRVVE